MVTGSEDGAATVDPGSAAEGTPSLDEDLGLLLDEIVPGGRGRLLAATRDAAARFLDHRLGAVGPAHAEPVGADEPGWPARLRGLGPDEGIVVVAEPTRWDVAVEALETRTRVSARSPMAPRVTPTPRNRTGSGCGCCWPPRQVRSRRASLSATESCSRATVPTPAASTPAGG